MTLNGHYALCFKTCASFGAQQENLNKDRPLLSATKMYSAMPLVSGNIRLMHIFLGVTARLRGYSGMMFTVRKLVRGKIITKQMTS